MTDLSETPGRQADGLDVALYFLVFVLSTPYYFYSLLPAGALSPIRYLLILGIFLRRPIRPRPILAVYALYIVVTYLAMVNSSVSYSKSGLANIGLISQFIFFACLLSEKSATIKRIFYPYLTLLLITVVPGLIYYFAILFNIDLSYSLISIGGRGDLYRNYHYLAIFGDYTVIPLGRFTITRLCGMFEEPGMLGTILGVVYVIDEIAFPEKRRRKLFIVVVGMLTLSLAFYFFLMLVLLRSMKREHIVKFAVVVVLLVIVIVTVVPADLQNAFQVLVMDRMAFNTETGHFAGDTRTGYGERYLSYLTNASLGQQLFGNGSSSNSNDEEAQYASYHTILYESGFVGFILLILFASYFLVYISANVGKWHSLTLTIFPLLSIYQRPDPLSANYLVLYALLFSIYIERRRLAKNFLSLKNLDRLPLGLPRG